MKINAKKTIHLDAKTIKVYGKVCDSASYELVDAQGDRIVNQPDGWERPRRARGAQDKPPRSLLRPLRGRRRAVLLSSRWPRRGPFRRLRNERRRVGEAWEALRGRRPVRGREGKAMGSPPTHTSAFKSS